MQSIAEQMAEKLKQIAVSEFFEQNRQILGFDTLPRSLLTCVKEAVDNSLDACEEARILPDIQVEISQIDSKDTYRVCIEDNGPGIVKDQIGNVFAKILYGSRFHAIRQARGQQGIGISACVLYAQSTTGMPTRVITKVAEKGYANLIELKIDTRRNEPAIVKDDVLLWNKPSGTRVEFVIKGKYLRNRQSPFEYLKQTAIVNPHARITLIEPDGTKTIFERATDELPRPTEEIKPHPQGIEIGILERIAKDTKSRTLLSFLSSEFSRVSTRVAHEICATAGLPEDMRVKDLTLDQKKALIDAFHKVKIMAPDPVCLSPIGPELIKKGLKNVLDAQKPDIYIQPETREPCVFRGHPFQVEAGMVFGGNLPADEPVQILRFANRVPLLYEQGACAITAAIENIDWRRYGLEQRGGKGIPVGPAVILVHVASTKLPFTSEAKVAIANVDEIREEIELALKACARRLKNHLIKKRRREHAGEKFTIVREVLPMMAEMCSRVLSRPVPDIRRSMTRIMNILLVEDTVEYRDNRHEIRVTVSNYTPKRQRFTVQIPLPENAVHEISQIKPVRDEKNRVEFEMGLAPSESAEVKIVLTGLKKDEYTRNEIYVTGVDPALLVGAEPPSGEMDIESLEVIEEGDESIPDVDEVKSDLDTDGEQKYSGGEKGG